MEKNKPTILIENKNTLEQLEDLRRNQSLWKEHDIYESQLKELFEITRTSLMTSERYNQELEKFVQERTSNQETNIRGNWVYFPWNGRLVHMLNEKEYTTLRTNRNRNLITQEEQQRLHDFCVGIVGLSVGSSVATTLAYSGIANTMKLAEFDTLETTNLNRIRARVDQIGMSKIVITAQQIYEINPYADLSFFSEGITKEILTEFVLKEPKPKLIFEIIDSFEMKIHLRSLAKESGIPVIMITNLGDRVLMDVERYDSDKNIEFFNGRAGNVPSDILKRPDATDEDKHKYAVELAGAEHIPQKAMDSVEQIGKTLVGRPQLASTVTAASAFSAYLTRKIALKEPLSSNSWLVDFDNVFREATSL